MHRMRSSIGCQGVAHTKIHMFAKIRRADSLFTSGAQLTAKSLDRSRFDMFDSVLLINQMEQRDISIAQVNVTERMRYMDEAVRSSTSCAILPLTTVNPDRGHFVSEVLLDNIITDTRQDHRMKATNSQIQQACGGCQKLLQ